MNLSRSKITEERVSPKPLSLTLLLMINLTFCYHVGVCWLCLFIFLCFWSFLEYRKHDRPSLSDEVWRLKKIAKGGKRHDQLCLQGVETVKDLLQLYITNQASLREVTYIPLNNLVCIVDCGVMILSFSS